MGRYFFTGGLMPWFGLLPLFDEHMQVEQSWTVNGIHYRKTAAAWRENLERNKDAVLEVLPGTYGDHALRWYHRWRIFFLSCEELFGFGGGEEWFVGHYLFAPRAKSGGARDTKLTARPRASWRAQSAGGNESTTLSA